MSIGTTCMCQYFKNTHMFGMCIQKGLLGISEDNDLELFIEKKAILGLCTYTSNKENFLNKN